MSSDLQTPSFDKIVGFYHPQPLSKFQVVSSSSKDTGRKPFSEKAKNHLIEPHALYRKLENCVLGSWTLSSAGSSEFHPKYAV